MTFRQKRPGTGATPLGNALNQLLSIASPPLCQQPPHIPDDLLEMAGSLAVPLLDLLRRKNGFVAFESALHLYPAGPTAEGYNLIAWNRADLWRDTYEDLADGFLFFAQDLFGDQFALREGRVYRFDAETGAADELATDLQGWATRLLSDYEVETGYPLAHAWQQQHRPLRPGERLVPRMLFALGGDFSVDNLTARDAAAGMRFRGFIAVQTRHLPNGTQIHLQIAE
jgi:hypothetical protein